MASFFWGGERGGEGRSGGEGGKGEAGRPQPGSWAELTQGSPLPCRAELESWARLAPQESPVSP